DYDMRAQPDDAIAAVNYLESAQKVSQIVVIGYSLGACAAIVAAHRDPRIEAGVSISGFANFDEIMLGDAFYAGAKDLLRGVTAESLSKQWSALGGALDPAVLVGQVQQPMLIVHGTEDEIAPYFMAPALQKASNNRADFVSIEGADHG